MGIGSRTDGRGVEGGVARLTTQGVRTYVGPATNLTGVGGEIGGFAEPPAGAKGAEAAEEAAPVAEEAPAAVTDDTPAVPAD